MDVRVLERPEVERVGSVLGLARLHQGDGFYLVAWQGDEPLGHLHLALSDPPELQDVQVASDHRRSGVARTLIAAAEREAHSRGFAAVRVGVGIDNAPAQALYRACGYVDVGLEPVHVKGTIVIRTGPIDVDEVLISWEKSLATLGHTAADDYCYLTTVGRRTGRPHRIEIWYAPDGDRLYLLAGGGRSCDWVRNLQADPNVLVEVNGQERSAHGRILEQGADEERARSLVFAKYAARYDGDLSGWRESAVPVVIDLAQT